MFSMCSVTHALSSSSRESGAHPPLAHSSAGEWKGAGLASVVVACMRTCSTAQHAHRSSTVSTPIHLHHTLNSQYINCTQLHRKLTQLHSTQMLGCSCRRTAQLRRTASREAPRSAARRPTASSLMLTLLANPATCLHDTLTRVSASAVAVAMPTVDDLSVSRRVLPCCLAYCLQLSPLQR